MRSSGAGNEREYPLVSVCIPTFNAEKYIEKTLASALNQSYSNIEVLVLDDCSEDATLRLVKSVDDKRVVCYRNAVNLGPQATWSRLLELAQGKYLKILCHDDLLYEQSILTQVEALNAFENVVLVASNRDIIDEDGNLVLSPKRFKANRTVKGARLLISSIRKGTNIIGEPHAVMMRMEVIRREGIKFEGGFYLIDLEFYSKLLMFGDAYLISKTLSAFRVYKEAASYRLMGIQAKNFLDFVRGLRLRKSPELPISFTDHLSARFMAPINHLMRRIFYRIYL